jgi:hypothetical protein
MNFQTLNRQRKFMLIAAAAGLIAMFLPWITISTGNMLDELNPADAAALSGSVSSSVNGMHGAGIVTFLSFLGVIALAFAGEQTLALDKMNWLVALACGAAALLFSVISLSNTPTVALGFVKSSVGYGAWIALVGAAAVLLSAWWFKNPGDTLKDNFDHLKKVMGKN